MDIENFGRVFLLKTGNNNKECVYEQLQWACFSNLDLSWYDLSGDFHPQFLNLKGKEFWMVAHIKNTNKNGVHEVYQAKILSPYKLGEFKTCLDMSYFRHVKRVERDIAEKLDILDPDDEEQMQTFAKSEGFMTFLTPQRQLLRESHLLAYISTLKTMEDIVEGVNDDSEPLSDQVRVSFSQVNNYINDYLKMLRGESGQKWKNFCISTLLHTPSIGLHAALQLQRVNTAAIKATKDLRSEALKFVTTEKEALPFFSEVENVCKAVAVKFSNEWNRQKDPELFQPAQAELGKITSGIPVFSEAVALQLGIRLTKEVRSSVIFKWFTNEVATFCCRVNDLLSYNSELITSKTTANEVYILHTECGLSLTDALKRVNDEINLSVRRITECGKLMLEMFSQNKNLDLYVEMVKGIMCGYIQSCSFVQRYHPNMVWDCYVESDDAHSSN